MEFDEQYRNLRYLTGQTGRGIGYLSTPAKEYIDQLSDKSIPVLCNSIPPRQGSKVFFILRKDFPA